jgi:hypothetical protein
MADKKIRKNLTGLRFENLLVKGINGKNKKGLTLWDCICDCGNECVVRIDLLTSYKTKSCGCLRKLSEGECNFNSLNLRYRNQAKERNLPFELNKDQFRKLTKQNCFYCGIEPQQIQNAKGTNGKYIYNGIDRLDNNIGYIENNVVACCGSCNRSKDTLDYEQYKKIIKRTYLNLYKKITDKTPGELIDSLITVDIKCFIFQDQTLDKNIPETQRLKLAETILELNRKRNRLMRSIDILFDFQEDMVTPKTYCANSDDNLEPEF